MVISYKIGLTFHAVLVDSHLKKIKAGHTLRDKSRFFLCRLNYYV